MSTSTSTPSPTLDPKYLTIPTSNDPHLPPLLHHCGTQFIQLRQCIDTANASFTPFSSSTPIPTSNSDSNTITTTNTTVTPNSSSSTPSSTSSSCSEAMKKEKTRYILQSCGYLRGPVRQCILYSACDQEKLVRDQYLTEPHQHFNSNHALHLDLQVNQCIRKYQAAMMVAWDPKSKEFKLSELDELK